MRNLSLILLMLLFSCHQNDRLEWALNQAGQNRHQLEAVLNHYRNDSLKYKAACFLIENMPYHFSIIEYYVTPEGKKYRPDLSKIGDVVEVRAHCDSLARNGYTIRKYNEYDIAVLDSNFLINNIELAFQVWQKPWAKDVSFHDFCRYILPYRSQYEPISTLREEMMNQFMPILDSLQVKSPLEACVGLNNSMSSIMRYRETGLPFYPTNEDTYYGGVAQCDGLCNLGTMIMRAVGIPVAIDMTVWVNMDFGHNWCSIMDDGESYPFDPGENSPDVLANKLKKNHWNKFGIVYRFCYDVDLSRLYLSNDDNYKTFLKSVLMKDVTAQYSTDSRVQVQVSTDKDIESKFRQVYLCTYNDNTWKPIVIGNRVDNICHFDDIVVDKVYAVCYSPDGEALRRITVPFYLSNEGEINKLIPKKQTHSYTLKKRTDRLYLPHTLRYWEPEKERFIELKYTESTDTTQSYDNIPVNALLWFSVPEKIKNQRIFIIEDDSLRYY